MTKTHQSPKSITLLSVALIFMTTISCDNTSTRVMEEGVVQSLKTQLRVSDLDPSRSFYTQIFSMEIVEEWDEPADRGVILKLPHSNGESLLELYQVADQHSFDGVSLQIRVPSADDFVKSLPADLNYEGPDLRPWGAKYVYLKDPAGVNIIVYEAAN